MWENQTQKETQQSPEQQHKVIYRASGRTAKEHNDSLLIIQCIVCAVILVFVFFVRNFDSAAFSQMSSEYHTMLTQGVDFGSETPLLRFVEEKATDTRKAVNAWAASLGTKQQMPQGSGGFWPVKKREVPEGASMDDYTLPETLTLPANGILTSGFGFRKNPVNGEDDFHAGIDIAADTGTSVIAALDGQVTETGYNSLRGNYIVLHHRAGLQSLYQHLNCGFVRTGEFVKAGDRIATVGETGYVTGPHLHLELIVDSLRVDPLPQFPQLQEQGK